MNEKYWIGAYWFGRLEYAKDCAHRAAAFFREFSRCDPAFTRWFEQAGSLKRALELEFKPTAETFEAMFSRKKYKGGAGGYGFETWNGRTDEEACGIGILCGSGQTIFPDSCVLELRRDGALVERVLTLGVASSVLRSMVSAWDPEIGFVTSHALQELIPGEKDQDDIGWITYLAHSRGKLPPLPEPVRIEPVEDKGSLLILTPERMTASNPAHVDLTKRVRQLLADAGLLARPPPDYDP